MNTYQWAGVGIIVVMFFGSLGLGRYLRWRDEKRDAVPIKDPVIHVDPSLLKDEIDVFAYYQAAAAEIMAGYHYWAVVWGEEYAKNWADAKFKKLREEIGTFKVD